MKRKVLSALLAAAILVSAFMGGALAESAPEPTELVFWTYQ